MDLALIAAWLLNFFGLHSVARFTPGVGASVGRATRAPKSASTSNEDASGATTSTGADDGDSGNGEGRRLS